MKINPVLNVKNIKNEKLNLSDSFEQSMKNGELEIFISSLASDQLKIYERPISKCLQSCLENWDQRTKTTYLEKIIDLIYSKTLQFSDITYPSFNHVIKSLKSKTNKSPKLIDKIDTKRQIGIHKFDRKRKYFYGKEQIRKVVSEITNNSLSLPDPENLCCSPFFFHDWRILRNQKNRSLIVVDKKRLLEDFQIEKLMCALLNSPKGGYILAGVKKKSLIVDGEIVDESEEKIIRENYEKAKTTIFPSNNSYESVIDFIPIKKDPLLLEDQRSCSNIFVIMIKLNPQSKEFFTVHNQQSETISIFVEKNGECHCSMQKPSKKVRFHKFSECHPRFTHKSILILGFQQKNGILDQLKQEFKKKKFSVNFSKPYPELSKNSTKMIQIISHNEKFSQIQKIKKNVDPQRKSSFFSLQKNLNFDFTTIETGKNLMSSLQSSFKNKFNKELKISQESSKKKALNKQTHLKFDSLQECQYAFVFLVVSDLDLRNVIKQSCEKNEGQE